MPNTKERDLVKGVCVLRDVSLIKIRTIRTKDVDQMPLFKDPVNPNIIGLFDVVGVFGDYVILHNPMGCCGTGRILKMQVDWYVSGLMDLDTKRREATERADYDAIDTEFNAIRREVIDQLPQVFAA